MREHGLYPPVKAFLEAQDYAVKGEIDSCDVVAIRGGEPPVIVELKTSFSLPLVFQGIARQGLSDNVYLAVPPFSGRTTRRKDALALCRRLGLGLLTVRLEPAPLVDVLLDPAAYCQTAFNIDPRSACKIDPPERHGGGCPGSQ